MSSDQSNFTSQLSSAFSSFQASLKPLSSEVSKSLSQASQYAREKIQGSQDSTDLPSEYLTLESKLESIRLMHELLLKVSRNYTLPAYDHEPLAIDKISSLASTVGQNAAQLAEKLSGSTGGSVQTLQDIPPSLAHCFAKAGYQSSQVIGVEEPLGAGLKKFADTQEKIGSFRVKVFTSTKLGMGKYTKQIQQDQEIISKFHSPMLQALDGRIQESLKSRRLVNSCRLTYDSLRSRLKTSPPSKQDLLKQEITKAEDDFVQAVDDSMNKMKMVLENPEGLRCLSDLVASQQKYHQRAGEALKELSVELDQLVVTNEVRVVINWFR